MNSDQLAAVAKYEEVQQTLEFARDLCKQFNGIAVDAAKQHKKQARKEALEKTQQEVSKVKEILLVQVSLYVHFIVVGLIVHEARSTIKLTCSFKIACTECQKCIHASFTCCLKNKALRC